MKGSIYKLVLISGLCLIMLSFWTGTAPAESPKTAYIIGPGDVLDISVWKDEALTKLVTVLPDGRISFPLIGQLTAGGKTVAKLQKELEQKLNRYVPDVSLSLLVVQVNSALIYVIGRVNNLAALS